MLSMYNIAHLIAPLTVLSLVSGAALVRRDTSSAAQPAATVSFASTTANDVLWGPDSPASVPKPVRGKTGASIQGPDNIPLDLENPDLLAPPSTDNGDV